MRLSEDYTESENGQYAASMAHYAKQNPAYGKKTKTNPAKSAVTERTFRLPSSPACDTPSVIGQLRLATPEACIELLQAAWPGLTRAAVGNLQRGAYQVEGTTVVVKG